MQSCNIQAKSPGESLNIDSTARLIVLCQKKKGGGLSDKQTGVDLFLLPDHQQNLLTCWTGIYCS